MGDRSQLATIEVRRTNIARSSAPLTKESHETSGGATLDAASLRSLRNMFLLLDEWDRVNQDDDQNSSEECEIGVDTKTR